MPKPTEARKTTPPKITPPATIDERLRYSIADVCWILYCRGPASTR